jgi:hypothetical protein
VRKLLLGVASSLASVLVAAPSMAAVLNDDFDGRSGNLTGQTADSGQSWTNFTFFGSYPSYTVNPDFGVGGTEGAGTKDSSNFAGNSVAFTGPSSGLVRFEGDLFTGAPAVSGSTTPIHQFWLLDSVNGTAASIAWYSSNNSVQFEGLGFSDPLHATGQTTNNATMHVMLDLDLTNKTAEYSWSGTDASSNPFSGSVDLGTYSPNFAPNQLHLWGRGESNVIASGWDNINYDIPEPAALTLFGALSGLGVLRRRRRSV